MIDIYTEKKNCEDWIIQNDLYFNLNTCNEEMTKRDINLIKQADDAALTPDKHIQTKFGLGTIRNLSSGCKTLLNIIQIHKTIYVWFRMVTKHQNTLILIMIICIVKSQLILQWIF